MDRSQLPSTLKVVYGWREVTFTVSVHDPQGFRETVTSRVEPSSHWINPPVSRGTTSSFPPLPIRRGIGLRRKVSDPTPLLMSSRRNPLDSDLNTEGEYVSPEPPRKNWIPVVIGFPISESSSVSTDRCCPVVDSDGCCPQWSRV